MVAVELTSATLNSTFVKLSYFAGDIGTALYDWTQNDRGDPMTAIKRPSKVKWRRNRHVCVVITALASDQQVLEP